MKALIEINNLEGDVALVLAEDFTTFDNIFKKLAGFTFTDNCLYGALYSLTEHVFAVDSTFYEQYKEYFVQFGLEKSEDKLDSNEQFRNYIPLRVKPVKLFKYVQVDEVISEPVVIKKIFFEPREDDRILYALNDSLEMETLSKVFKLFKVENKEELLNEALTQIKNLRAPLEPFDIRLRRIIVNLLIKLRNDQN